MQVSLKQADVEKAIALYLDSMGITATVESITFKAGRKGAGLLTNVSLTDAVHAPIPAQPNTVTEAPAATESVSQEEETPWTEPEQEAAPTTESNSNSLFG